MAITDIFLDRRPKLGLITIDCSVSETHSRGHRISRYPVEGLADKSDHFQDEPDRIELEGLVSQVGANIVGVPLEPSDPLGQIDRGKQAWQMLQTLQRSHEPFTVVTSLQVYTGMVFDDGDSLIATRSYEDSEVLRFTARLVKYQVSFTKVEEAIAAEIEDLAGKGAVAGTQSTTPAASNTASAALGAL